MARIKAAVNAHKKRRKVLKLAKGYYGAKSKQYRAASEQVARSLRYAYEGRKMRKRDFRRLWITRINAAARLNGMSYSVLMDGLKKKNIQINRKMLADIAVNAPEYEKRRCHRRGRCRTQCQRPCCCPHFPPAGWWPRSRRG